MTICEFLVAIIGVTISVENQSGQKALIALVCLYIAGFASTWGPIAWVIVGEIFPLAIRAKAMSLSVASNWLWNFAISYATPYLVNPGPGNAGLGVKVFFIWGSTCFCCTIFAFLCVPEVRPFFSVFFPLNKLSDGSSFFSFYNRLRVSRSSRSTSCTSTPPSSVLPSTVRSCSLRMSTSPTSSTTMRTQMRRCNFPLPKPPSPLMTARPCTLYHFPRVVT